MPLPTSRNTTYTPASPVKSVDLNDLQDTAVNAWTGAHGDRVLWVPAHTGGHGANWTRNAAGVASSTSSPGAVSVHLPLRVGDRIKEIEIHYWIPNPGSEITYAVMYIDLADLQPYAFSPAVSGSGTIAALSVSVPFEYTVPVDRAVFVSVGTDGTGNEFAGLHLTYDHPPVP